MNRCYNKKCQDEIPEWEIFCPACRLIGKKGIFVGGLLMGIIVAILKLVKVL